MLTKSNRASGKGSSSPTPWTRARHRPLRASWSMPRSDRARRRSRSGPRVSSRPGRSGRDRSRRPAPTCPPGAPPGAGTAADTLGPCRTPWLDRSSGTSRPFGRRDRSRSPAGTRWPRSTPRASGAAGCTARCDRRPDASAAKLGASARPVESRLAMASPIVARTRGAGSPRERYRGRSTRQYWYGRNVASRTRRKPARRASRRKVSRAMRRSSGGPTGVSRRWKSTFTSRPPGRSSRARRRR